MSSHHIIRENQEPALVILQAQAIPFDKVQELLEWSPTIVVLASEVGIVLGWGIKIDVVLCPFDEVEHWRKTLADQYPIKILGSRAEDPLHLALDYLVSVNTQGVNIMGGDRDHFSLAEKYTTLYIEYFFDDKRWSWIRSGSWEKWLPSSTTLYLWPKAYWMKAGFDNGVLHVISDGLFKLELPGSFWIGEDLK